MDPNATSWVLQQGYLLVIAASLAAGSVAAAVMFRLYYLLCPKRNSGASWPVSPPALPLLGHLHLLGAKPHHDMAKLSQKYGPLYHLRMGSTHTLVVSSAAMAKEVLKIHDKSMASRPNCGACSEIITHNFQDLAGAPYGAHWRAMRKICLLELFTTKRLESFQYMRDEETSSFVRNMMEEYRSGNPVNMPVKLTQLTLNVVTRMAMGKSFIRWGCSADVAAESKKFRDIIQEMFILAGVVNNLGDYFPFLRRFDLQGYVKRTRAAVQKFDSVAYQMIAEKRRDKKDLKQASDLLDVLLSLAGDDGTLSDEKVVAVLLDILTAGVDTSSSTLEWSLTELIKEPEKMKRLQAEIESVVGTERKVFESDLPSFPYLYAVVKETLRLHPPAPLLLPHESTELCMLQGYSIPAKTRLYVNVFAIGRDPAVYDRPGDFVPERFLDSQIDCRGQDFELLPFGSGRRVCPGMNLGLMMMQLTLARLLHCFDFSLPTGQNPRDIDMDETFGLTCFKAEPLQVVPKPRTTVHKLY